MAALSSRLDDEADTLATRLREDHIRVREAGGQHIRRQITVHAQKPADVLVSAVGTFATPSYPDITGLDSFAGPCFHSARWEHRHDLAGRRVAVIGTGASAAQIVPELATEAQAGDVFQRTPPWILRLRAG